jgi:hypothetical protein
MNFNPKCRPSALMRLYAALDALEMRIDSNINDVRRTQRDHLHGALENMRFELDTIGHQMNAAAGANVTEFTTCMSRHTQALKDRERGLREATAAAKALSETPRTEALLTDISRSLQDLVLATVRHRDAIQRRGGA